MNMASAPATRSSEEPLGAAADCVVTTTIWPLQPTQLARQARHLLRADLAGRICDPVVLDDLDVMMSEVATNAGLYSPGPYELRVVRHDAVPVAVELADPGPGLDRVAACLALGAVTVDLDTPDDVSLALGGRGLSIVARLSAGRCGVHPTRLKGCSSTGKSVWFAIPTGPPNDSKETRL